jgi:hypothetical protein
MSVCSKPPSAETAPANSPQVDSEVRGVTPTTLQFFPQVRYATKPTCDEHRSLARIDDAIDNADTPA